MTRRNTATPEEIVRGIIDAKVPPETVFLDTAEVGEVLGMTSRSVLYLIKDGLLGYIATGKKNYRIPREVLVDYMLTSYVPAKVSDAEKRLAELEQAITEHKVQLANLALNKAKVLDGLDQAIEQKQARLDDLDQEITGAKAVLASLLSTADDLTTSHGRTAQTVP